MDARLREATSAEILTAIGKLFRALPPRRANPEELLESYEIACHKATKHAIETVVLKLIRGELEKLSKSFAPSPAELSAAIRDEMEFVKRQIDLAAERIKIEDNRPTVINPPNAFERVQKQRDQMAAEGRKLLFTVAHVDQLRTRKAEIPTGFRYIALTGEVFGAPGSAYAAAATDPEPVTDDVAW